MAGLFDFLQPSNSGGGGVLGQDVLPQTPGGNIGAGLASFAHSNAPLPAIANLISGLITGQRTDPTGVQQDLMRAQLQSMMQMPDYQGAGGLAHALATMQNPAVSTAQFGNPSELGTMKVGPVEVPVVGHAGRVWPWSCWIFATASDWPGNIVHASLGSPEGLGRAYHEHRKHKGRIRDRSIAARTQDYAGFSQALNDLHDVISGAPIRMRVYLSRLQARRPLRRHPSRKISYAPKLFGEG